MLSTTLFKALKSSNRVILMTDHSQLVPTVPNENNQIVVEQGNYMFEDQEIDISYFGIAEVKYSEHGIVNMMFTNAMAMPINNQKQLRA